MNQHITFFLAFLISTGSLCHRAPAADKDLAQAGYDLMRKYCFDCHGSTFNGSSTFDLNNIPALTQADEGEEPYVVLGADADESYMWQRIADGDMPPQDSSQPSSEQRETIRRWIAAGVPMPESRTAERKSEAEVVAEILRDVESFDASDAKHQRYFTMHHVAARKRISIQQMRLYRAALSKVVNSLSLRPDIVLPVAIDDQQTIFRIDLRKLGWDERELWRALLREYPYSLTYDRIEHDDQLRRGAIRLAQATQSKVSYIRADWFIVQATRESLYNQFVEIPATAKLLEQRLGVDVEQDFLADLPRLDRAGFDESGVSIGARVLNRHSLPSGGYYWKSDDFVKQNRRSTLYRFALGPLFDGNPFGDRFGYQHDGGEMIFSLPNGLQGYMLVDGQGNQISKGPIEVVRDSKEIGGTPEVVNAISCMHCHQHGMIRFEDSVRESLGIRGEALNKALEIYTPADEMRALVRKDRAAFLSALQVAIGPFLQVESADRIVP